MLHGLIEFWFRILEDWGYLGIVVLMAMESSVFPVPSEIVIPPAVYWVSQGRMDFWAVVLAGTAGSWIGSAATYWAARVGGRAFIERYGKWFRISAAGVDRAERFLHRYEAGGVFFSRLLPVIRHLVSIPAGILTMNFRLFSIVTIAGSFAWCWILARFSQVVFAAHQGEDLISHPDQLVELVKSESLPLVAGIVVLCILYLGVLFITRDNTDRR